MHSLLHSPVRSEITRLLDVQGNVHRRFKPGESSQLGHLQKEVASQGRRSRIRNSRQQHGCLTFVADFELPRGQQTSGNVNCEPARVPDQGLDGAATTAREWGAGA